jgi:hypothetical protein
LELYPVTFSPDKDFTFDLWFLYWANDWGRVYDFYYRNEYTMLILAQNNTITNIPDGANITIDARNKWCHIALCYDSEQHIFYNFFNGSLIAKQENYNMPERTVRIWFGKSSYGADPPAYVLYQNIRLEWKCIFKEEFDYTKLSNFKYLPCYFVHNNLKTPTLVSE